MNIKRELTKAQFRKDVTDRFKRALKIANQYLCQHRDCGSEIITVSLGNTSDSLIAELFSNEELANKSNVVKLRRVYCLNCGRELYREVLSVDSEE